MKAGIMVAGEGLHPSSKGKRLRLAEGKRTVVDGPFPETNELIAGFWIWKVKSMEESVIEIRPVFGPEDFGAELTPELRAQEDRLRAEVERQRHS